MSLTSKNSKIMAEESDKVTSPIVHNDSSAEPDHIPSSTAQKDSSPDNKSTTSLESDDAAIPSSSGVQTVNAPNLTVTVYKRSLKPATTTAASSNNNADTRRLIIPNMTLRFNSLDDALGDGLMGREPMPIKDDDVAVVKDETNSQTWVTKLIQAYTKDYLSNPEDPTKNTPAQQEWFTRWQKQAHASIVTIVNSKNAAHLEKACWHLLKTVIQAHELGAVDAAGNLTPSKLKCSERLAFIAAIMEKYALVRLDVLRAWHVDEIAANPEAFIKRKLVNCWNNGHRAEKAKIAQKGGEVAGAKRAASDVDEQGEGHQAAGKGKGKGKKARKSLAGGATDGEPKTNGNTGIKHSRSALTPRLDDEEFTSNKRPATPKASSADNVKANGGEVVDDDGEKE